MGGICSSVGEIKNANILVREPEGKRSLGRPQGDGRMIWGCCKQCNGSSSSISGQDF
jgi:hypothetical protein